MNVYDSGRMADILAPLGYQMADRPEGADMVILNTCHIREKAAEKVYSDLGRLRALKNSKAEDGGKMIVAVAGCVAQAEGDEILRRVPAVDMVFGPQSYHRLPEMIAQATRARGGQVLDTDFPVEPKFDHLPLASARHEASAFLTVQEGCDKFCAFCVVPYTRGAEYSRPVADVDAEARHLVAGGAMEITLLGQNVNAYHGVAPDGGAWGLGRLIRQLAEIPGLARLRYTTSHPRDMDDDLILAHRDIPQLMPFMHLPVQSGSDRILQAMNRQHTAEDYERLVGRVRDACPEIGLSSDFIVGFPGETEGDFEDTLALVRNIGFAQAYSFKYSPRPGTPATNLGPQVAEQVKSERLARVHDELSRQQIAFNQSSVGRRQQVLFERGGRKEGQQVGRGPYMQAVHVQTAHSLIGNIAEVEILAAGPNSLEGRLTAKGPVGNDGHNEGHPEPGAPERGAVAAE